MRIYCSGSDRSSRKEYELKYTAAINFQRLLQIYQREIDSCRVRNAMHGPSEAAKC